MAGSRRFSPVRGRIMRVTRLDNCGRPIYGADSQVTSKGFVTVAASANNEVGSAIQSQNANGDYIVNEPGQTTFGGYGLEAVFNQVDPHLFAIATGQLVIEDPATGDAIGFTADSDVSPDDAAFALEVWTGVPAVECSDEGQGVYGYVLFPFIKGAVFGDFTIENNAINFTLSSGSTRNGSAWGAGPYKVMMNAVAAPSRLLGNAIVTAFSHLRVLLVEVAPPEDTGGAYPVLDPADSAVTSFTAVDGLAANEIDFDALPTDLVEPVVYLFGDDTWEYAVGGSVSHTYTAAGTYQVTARRGLSSVTQTVVVPVP